MAKSRIVTVLLFVIIMTGTPVIAQIFPNYTWTSGQPADPTTGFVVYGGNTYNAIVSGTDPFGESSPIWEVSSQGTGQYPGFGVNGLVLSPDKTYRFSIWVKQVNSLTPQFALYITSDQNNGLKNGAGQPVSNYDITPTGWRVPQLDTWYLLVGYIRADGDTNAYTGGVYEYRTDLLDSYASLSIATHEFQSSVTTFRYRPYISGPVNINDKVYLFDPRVDEVTDDDVSDLIFPDQHQGPGTGDSVWVQNGTDVYYSSGNVGIGTADPGTYRLAVNGSIHAKEVKVDMTGWADYVFVDGYRLPSLEEVKKHIEEKGHLINIPSAKEVEANGIALGEMDRLLLEKIEELTLYILEIKKEQNELKSILGIKD